MNNDNSEKTFHQAARDGDVKRVKELLAEGAIPDVQDENGKTPLHVAAERGHENVVNLLLFSHQLPRSFPTDKQPKPANPNIKDNDGKIPLHCAAAGGHNQIVVLLLSRSVDSNVQDNYGSTPLHYAVEGGHMEVIVYLLEERPQWRDIKDKQGRTPLYLASLKGDVLVIRRLAGDV